MAISKKKYALELVDDPATRANFDLVAKELDQLRKAFTTINYVTSNPTVESPAGSGIGFVVTSLYPIFTDIVPLSIQITTTGNPVLISLAPRSGDNNFQGNIVGQDTTTTNATVGFIRIYRDDTIIYETAFGGTYLGVLQGATFAMPPNAFWHRDDIVPAGEYTYKVSGAMGVSGQTLTFNWVRMWVQELITNPFNVS